MDTDLSSVSLSTFNKLRNPDDPVPLRTLRRQAAKGLLPGAIFTGTRWRVVLKVYDKSIREQLEADSGQSADNDLRNLANEIDMAIGSAA